MKAKNKKTSPANGRYTLMTESEYIEDILRSERGENLPSKSPKTSKTRVTREEAEKPQPKSKHGKGIDNSNECEPTSSKVKVEDLVTDKEEQLLAEEYALEEATQANRTLFDRPIPPRETRHIYDPRLPKELNELLQSMQDSKWRTTDLETYQQARPEEMLEGQRAPRIGRTPNKRKKRAAPQLRLPTIDESMASLDDLRRRYDHKRRRPPDHNRNHENPSRSSKGKEKAVVLTEEDIPQLTQRWHDEYQDILQGTKEELPPLREVNHEINLIDPDKRYNYHLPRCPSAYRSEFHEKLN